MSLVTADEVRQFIIEQYADALQTKGHDLTRIAPDLDLLTEGIIDSFAILELVTAIEDRFGITLDLADLGPENLTVIGPFSEYVANFSTKK